MSVAVGLLDERTLLRALEDLLDREDDRLRAGDPDGLVMLAAERERLTTALMQAAQARRKAPVDATVQAELDARYCALRERHETRGQVVRRFADRTARAIGVLAQASGQAGTYGADGRMAVRWGAA